MMHKHFYFYKITLTNKEHELFNHYYYGARITTKNPEEDYYKGSSSIIKKSGYWDVHPLDYKKEIIKIFDNAEDLYEYEYQTIGTKYKDDPLCLNRFIGGIGGHSTWNKTEEEIKEIHSKGGKKNKGKSHILKHPEITSERLSKINKGRVFSEEWKNNISKSRIGIKISKEQYKDYDKFCKDISDRQMGKLHTEETKEKISIKLTEYYQNEDNRKRLQEATKKAMESLDIREKCRNGGKTTKGKIFINKDNINKRVKLEELQSYINSGWQKGRYISWTKRN